MSLTQRIGRRGCALLFFTLLDLVYALNLVLAPQPVSPLYGWMEAVAPLTAWAVCWGAVGLICFWYAFQTHDTPAFVSAVALKVGWGLLAFFGWLAGEVANGYVSGVIWLAFAAFVSLIAGGIPPAAPRPAGRWQRWTL